MAEPAFSLTLVESPEPKLSEKPGWWMARVEGGTREHREHRASRLIEAGRDRAMEALWVHEQLVQGELDEEYVAARPNPLRELPGATPDVKKVLRHWDRQIASSSDGKRRLLRGEHESVQSWRARIQVEIERRAEGAWHTARAAGQREKFRTVEKCGTEIRGVLLCMHCHGPALGRDGKPILIRDLCGSHLLCQRCREHRRRKYRAKFSRARLHAVQAVRAAKLGPGQARTDPVIERLLTLTCPHIPLDVGVDLDDDGIVRFGPELQAMVVRRAWRAFMNALRNHWRGRPGFNLSRYVRVLEATTGRDELGHVHIHAWLLSHFVRAQVYRALWGRALMRAGFPMRCWPERAWRNKYDVRERDGTLVEKGIMTELSEAGDEVAYDWAKHALRRRCPWPRVDIKRVERQGTRATVDGRDLAFELIKYLTKDFEDAVDGEGPVLMHPALFSAVYRGLDSGRMLTASRDFWVKYHSSCEHCGSLDQLRPVEMPDMMRPMARAPPLEEYQRAEWARGQRSA